MFLSERLQPRAFSWSAAQGLAAEAAPTKASTVGAALTPGCRSPHPPCPARHTCAAPHRCRVRHTIAVRSEEHTSELQSLMRISYAVFCLKKKKNKNTTTKNYT